MRHEELPSRDRDLLHAAASDGGSGRRALTLGILVAIVLGAGLGLAQFRGERRYYRRDREPDRGEVASGGA
jgi:hypothetical protein